MASGTTQGTFVACFLLKLVPLAPGPWHPANATLKAPSFLAISVELRSALMTQP